jgi:ribosomal protein S18 acetylase RimI-like enzyme
MRDSDPRRRTSHRLKRMRSAGLKPPIPGEAELPKRRGGRLRLGPADLRADLRGRPRACSRRCGPRGRIGATSPSTCATRTCCSASRRRSCSSIPPTPYRLDLATYRPARSRRQAFFVRRLATEADAEVVNAIYAARNMVPVPPDFFWRHRDARALVVLVAEDAETGEILGSVMGVDHMRAFGDPERGSSLWCLAVAPQAPHAGVGESLVRRLAEHFQARGAAYMDLSVLHDNEQAIALYEKLGFYRVPVFAVKRKNPINERLYTGRLRRRAEPLRTAHRRRGAAAGHPCRGDRRRGRVLPADLRRAVGAVPRVACRSSPRPSRCRSATTSG